MGIEGEAAVIFNLGTRWRWIVSFTFQSQGKHPQYPLNGRLGGSQNQEWNHSSSVIWP